MEMRGIEPLSVKESIQTSTCLVYDLILFIIATTNRLNYEPVPNFIYQPGHPDKLEPV